MTDWNAVADEQLDGPVRAKAGVRGANKSGPDNEYPVKRCCECPPSNRVTHRDSYDDVRCVKCGHGIA